MKISHKTPIRTSLAPATVGKLGGPIEREPWLYIGRAHGTFQASPWANPFRLVKDTPAERVAILSRYAIHALHHPDLTGRLPELAGKHLLCYCHPKPCHGHVLAQLLPLVQFHGSACPECGGRIKSYVTWNRVLKAPVESWVCQEPKCLMRGLEVRENIRITFPDQAEPVAETLALV